MKLINNNSLLAACVALLISGAMSSSAALLFSEDWESGTIDTAKWNVVTGGTASTIQEVRNISIDSVSNCLVQAVGTNGYGYAYVESQDAFRTDDLVIKYRQYRRTDSGYTSSKDAMFSVFRGNTQMMSLNWNGNGTLYGSRVVGGTNAVMGAVDLASSLNEWTDWRIVYTPGVQPMLSIIAHDGNGVEIYNKNVTIDAMDNIKIRFKTWNDDTHWNWVRWDDILVTGVPAALLSENWESNSIDTSKWDVVTGGTASTIQEVRNISSDTGSYCLVQAVGTGAYGYAYTESQDTFGTDAGLGLAIKYRQYRRTDNNYTSKKDAMFRIYDGSTIMASLAWNGNGSLYGSRVVGGTNAVMGAVDMSSSLNKWTDWKIIYTHGAQPMLSVVAYDGATEVYNKNVTIDAMDNIKIQFKTWNDDTHWNWVRWDDISIDVYSVPGTMVIVQ